MFVQNKNIFTLADNSTVEVEDIEKGVYRLKSSLQLGLYLEKIEDNYILPNKVYGNPEPRATRILETWRSREKNTGVLLSGDKGSGKSLLMQMLCNKAVNEDGAAIVIISDSFSGPELTDLLSEIKRPLVIAIDEFEKIYNRNDGEAQKKILSTMDGSNLNRALFVLTVNNRWAVDTHMLNRPGRIFYHYKYSGLTEDFIREYCEDTLEDKSKIDDIIPLTLLVDGFSFDILKALVEELNRYGESVADVISHLNVDVAAFDEDPTVKYSVDLYDNEGNIVTNFFKVEDRISKHPLRELPYYPIYFYRKDETLFVDDEFKSNVPETIRSDEFEHYGFKLEKENAILWDKFSGEVTYEDPKKIGRAHV